MPYKYSFNTETGALLDFLLKQGAKLMVMREEKDSKTLGMTHSRDTKPKMQTNTLLLFSLLV
jgi:hypothetical protein